MERYVCIHGHFYQPPRENPWLEAIEIQDSAYPYHDWNERITAECYEPNSNSRILDSKGRIAEIVNNYARISFNFGPTVLAWMQRAAPEVHSAIIDADKESKELFSGHGSAMAQVYNHLIMPLANRRDKQTQVLWGIEDFQRRFGRLPEGMWLPETAADLETLDVLAEFGITFTILAPHQARRVRQIGSTRWQDVAAGTVDPTRAYELHLASGRKINLFFYDGPVSRAVAFEGLLADGEAFASRLLGAFSNERNWNQLVNIATDGESYGHHHRYGEMALAYAIRRIETKGDAKVTNYGEFLEKNPPIHEVEIIERTSWSCVHGVDRWWRDCGCNTGGHHGWNQAWRTPLRNAMDWLRDTVAPNFEKSARQLLKDPWQARDHYVSVMLDRRPKNVGGFLKNEANHRLNKSERTRALKLLELQRHAMLMYTSCGWFFDELSGLETTQVIQYAGRVAQLSAELFGDSIESHFVELLESAKSNIPEHENGRAVYDKFVKPATIDLTKVGAHYAISSLFEDYGERSSMVFCYLVSLQEYKAENCGKQRVAVGRVCVTSEVTHESTDLSFGVVHFGDHNISAGVRAYRGKEAYGEMLAEITRTCLAADFPGTIRLLDKHFGASTYSLRSLFRDEQRKVLNSILQSTLSEVDSDYRKVYESRYPLMRFIVDLGNPLPNSLKAASEIVLNVDLRNSLTAATLDREAVNRMLNDARSWGVALDNQGLAHAFRLSMDRKMSELEAKPEDRGRLGQMVEAAVLAHSLDLSVELRGAQNKYYRMLKTTYPQLLARARSGDQGAADWVSQFTLLGERLSMRVE